MVDPETRLYLPETKAQNIGINPVGIYLHTSKESEEQARK